MSTAYLLGLAVVAIAILLLLVIKAKMPAFVAMILVSFATAIAGGIPLAKVVPTLTGGMGKTLGSVAIIVGLGAMLGRMIEVSGGAENLARRFTERLGAKRVVLAVTCAAFILGIPVFFDVGVIILAPIVFGFAAVARISPLKIGLPVSAVLLAVHVAVPPHPGPVAAAATLGADAGLLTVCGLLACIPMAIVCYLVSQRMSYDHIELLDSPATEAIKAAESAPVESTRRVPGAGTVMGLILVPIAMIMLGTTGSMLLPKGTARDVLGLIGAPPFALLVGALLAYWVISANQGWDLDRRSDVMDSALPMVAVIIFVTGAGGVFANVLIETGVGKALSGSLQSMGMPILLMAYVIAAGLRIAQGSATVAILTTAGLVQSAVAAGGYSQIQVVLILLAIAFGGYIASHINDSGFWIVTRYMGLSVADGLKTWTVLSTIGSLVGFATVAAAWMVV